MIAKAGCAAAKSTSTMVVIVLHYCIDHAGAKPRSKQRQVMALGGLPLRKKNLMPNRSMTKASLGNKDWKDAEIAKKKYAKSVYRGCFR